MLKFYCALTGDQYKMVGQDTPQSRQKVALLACCILLPIAFWAFNGYLLSYKILGNSLAVSIFMSLFCAFIVYILERVIIQSPNDRRIKNQRIAIGVCTAILGAIAFDEVVFHQDIEKQLEKNRGAVAIEKGTEAGRQFDALHQAASKFQQVQDLKANYDLSVQDVKNEMDGKGSKRGSGVGRVTAEKKRLSADAKTKWEKAESDYNQLLIQKAAAVAQAEKDAEARKDEGLIARVGALFQLVFSSPVMALYFIVFMALMFFLEFIVVLVKSATLETNYERRLKMIDEIGKRRMEMLMATGSPLVSADYTLPSALAARDAMMKKNGSILN